MLLDSKASHQRRYGFACITCRSRKIKCDGEKPHCRRCVRSSLQCSYPGTDASAARLRTELARSRARVSELEEGINSLGLATGDERERRIRQLVSSCATSSTFGARSEVENVDAGDKGDVRGHNEDDGDEDEDDNDNNDDDDDDDDDADKAPQAEVTVQEDGSVSYFGATSRFHDSPGSNLRGRSTKTIDRTFHSRWLSSNARFQKSWEEMALAQLNRGEGADPLASSTLLRIYWTWQAPLHNCVYRHCFFRDMVMGGPYFSAFLLNVIFAHASRHIPDSDPLYVRVGQGDEYLKKAKLLLLAELEAETPRIPTIQGLLILGGRQCAVGKNSEGWLYTGMAIRMIKDLGLHLNSATHRLTEDLEPDDLEARKRLFLSAYAWDKSISLCLGRPPSLTEMPYSPGSLLDDSGDSELWTPFYLGEENVAYPPTPALTTSSFVRFCQLSMIVNDCYNTIYTGRVRGIKVHEVFSLEKKLRTFYEQLPVSLKIDSAERLDFCPPPHIFCLQRQSILFHTLLILIYRPFFSTRSNHPLTGRAREVCLENATIVNAFFRIYGRTFNFRNQTYLISYCVYTAATVDLLEMQQFSGAPSRAAADRLTTTMAMLESEARQTPGIRRSIDIISSRLQTKVSSTELPAQRLVADAGNGSPSQRIATGHAEDSLMGATVEEEVSRNSINSDFGERRGTIGAEPYLVGDNGTPWEQQYGSDYSTSVNMDVQGSLPWMSYDASGGFNPDIASWTWYDTIGHPESW